MSRWSQAYKARHSPTDRVDTVDIVQLAKVAQPYSVNTVNSVTRPISKNEAASDAAYLATERAAVIAEGEHGDARTAVAYSLPVAWADAAIEPTAGSRCSCCKGVSWWCEAIAPKGWRCSACHPPGHIQPTQIRKVTT